MDSIRLFDPASQRSTDTVQSIRIIPAHETLPAMTDHEELDRLMGRIDVSTCDEAHRERIREEFSQLMEGGEVEDLNLYAGFFNHGSLADYIPANSLFVHVRPGDIAAAAWDTQQRVHDLRETKEARGELPATSRRSTMRGTGPAQNCHGSARSLTCSTGGPKT